MVQRRIGILEKTSIITTIYVTQPQDATGLECFSSNNGNDSSIEKNEDYDEKNSVNTSSESIISSIKETFSNIEFIEGRPNIEEQVKKIFKKLMVQLVLLLVVIQLWLMKLDISLKKTWMLQNTRLNSMNNYKPGLREISLFSTALILSFVRYIFIYACFLVIIYSTNYTVCLIKISSCNFFVFFFTLFYLTFLFTRHRYLRKLGYHQALVVVVAVVAVVVYDDSVVHGVH